MTNNLTNLYFVRHAHSIYTPDEVGRPLSQKGFLDAEKVTDILKSEEIDIVLSSPYKRAIQTVEGIANYRDIEIEIVEDFKERLLTINPVEDFTLAISKVWEDFNFAWDGGESNRIAQNRGVKATFNIINKYRNKNIVVGTHGNIMALIMNHFDNAYDFSFWENLEMPDVYKLSFDRLELKAVKKLTTRAEE